MDYETIKQLAKDLRIPISRLLALNASTDPFYAGVPQRRKNAEWFASLWEQYGLHATHLRRLHYVLLSTTSIVLPNSGRIYSNTKEDYTFLIGASLGARYLRLIPEDALIDRRNIEPLIYDYSFRDQREQHEAFSAYISNEEPDIGVDYPPDMPPLPSLTLDDLTPFQSHVCEIWVEKSGVNDVLIPICERRRVNLVVGLGEQSEIRSRELAMRSARYGVPVRVLYISDFDPGGQSMPKAVARKAEFPLRCYGLDEKVDLQIIPLALSLDQVIRFNLPPVPLKESEHRADKFKERFGVDGAVELDALEALHPGELAKLVNATLDRFQDDTLAERTNKVCKKLEGELDKINERVLARHADEIETYTKEFDREQKALIDAIDQFNQWKDSANEEVWEPIAKELAEELEKAKDILAVELPQSKAPGTVDEFVLFDSKRTYIEQMDAYNHWKDGTKPDEVSSRPDDDDGAGRG